MNFRRIYIVGFLVIALIQTSCAADSQTKPKETAWSLVITEQLGTSGKREIHLITSDGEVIHVRGYPIQNCRVALSKSDIKRIMSIQSKEYLEVVPSIDVNIQRPRISLAQFPEISIHFNLGEEHQVARYPSRANAPDWIRSYIRSIAAIVHRRCPSQENVGLS